MVLEGNEGERRGSVVAEEEVKGEEVIDIGGTGSVGGLDRSPHCGKVVLVMGVDELPSDVKFDLGDAGHNIVLNVTSVLSGEVHSIEKVTSALETHGRSATLRGVASDHLLIAHVGEVCVTLKGRTEE